MPAQSEVQLQKPGAGLPLPEALIVRYWVGPRYSRKFPWDHSVAKFRRESDRILALLRPLDAAALDTQVLIPRIRGIEDSSRFWSAAMTAEHLMIVGSRMSHFIGELSQGRVPDVQVDTARVKPEQKLKGAEAVAAFAEFAQATARAVEKPAGDRESRAKLLHPWFGPFTAHQWNWLLAEHQGLHRRQIEAILAGWAGKGTGA